MGAALLAFCTNLLPSFMRARIKEKLEIIGKLDYKPKKIYMAIDNHWQIQRLYACSKEPETVAWIEKSIQANDVFYDVGANVGAYSFVAWAAAAGKLKVYAFEPSPSSFAALSKNIVLNNCSDVITPFNLALVDETKLLHLNYSNIEAGAASHSLDKGMGMSKGEAQRQVILGYALDDFVRKFDLAMPNYMKIDVDGAEMMVLGGAHCILAHKGLESILIEVDNFGSNFEKVDGFLIEHNFKRLSKFTRGRHDGSIFNCIYQRGSGEISCAVCNQ